MTYQTIKLEKEGKVGWLILNRPAKLNAINDTMLHEIESGLEVLQQDPNIWVVVIKGEGGNFSVGQDLSGVDTAEVMPPNPYTKPYLSELYEMAMKNYLRWQAIFDFPRWTIAQVQGYCLGMGCDLAMCCRTVIAAEDSVFGDPSIRMGLAPTNPLWVWRIGLKKAKELLLTGRYIDGKEAERIGLVMKAVPEEQLEKEVSINADTLSKYGTIGGFDMQVGWFAFDRASFDLAGLAAGWRLVSNYHALSAIQRPGRSYIDRGGFDFYRIREEKGLKEAIRQRDLPFLRYFPSPKKGS
jgi:enoyl-CoA hydratase